MVYEDESSNDLSSLDISSSSDGMMYRIPASIDDEDYMGIENSVLDVCSEHGLPPERRVAFEGFETGRRFLVCAQPMQAKMHLGHFCCRLSFFLIPPLSLFITNGQVLSDCLLLKMELRPCVLRPRVSSHNATLLKLWEMFEDNKSGRRDDNLENSLKIHHLTKEKRNLDANYDKLVEDVNQLFNAQEERVMDLSYLKVNAHGAESSSFVVAVMKSEIEKKEAGIMEVKGKYSVLMNLAEAQGRVIRTQKANRLKEKEKLSEENYNLKVQVDKLTKYEEKLNDDIVVLNLHIDGMKKGIENLIKHRDELKLQIADQLKALEKNQEKLKMIRDILDG
ncbi:hypothetical protein D1007_21530 [Hordeum vulgare]|nr:hypothetical protein D1007_21530 [Hordeum vulgare]